ncbi:MAG: hypothetical protein K0Q63_2458, partial [Paenibacillus sp.]|nr:hypothetical protein [Paenibacillus sp.]
MTKWVSQRYKKWFSLIICFFMLGATVPWTSATKVSAEPEGEVSTMRLYPTADSYVRGGTHSSTNFGSETFVVIKTLPSNDVDTREGYMKFDLSEIPGIVESASLNVYGALNGPAGTNEYRLHLYEVANDQWTESELTWETKPPIGAEAAASMLVDNSYQWRSFDVTDYASRERSGDALASFSMAMTGATQYLLRIDSKEHTGMNAPYLEVQYSESEDVEPPAWPAEAGLLASRTGETTVRLSWPAAADDSGMSGYRIFKNEVLWQSVGSGTLAIDATGLQIGEKYAFKVEAGDIYGNWSTDGPSADVTLEALSDEDRLLTASADAYVRAGSTFADANYGTGTSLETKSGSGNLARQSLLSFELDPLNEPVGSAVLYLYGGVTDGGGSEIVNTLYGVSPGLDEAAVTWNTKPEFIDFLGDFQADKTMKWLEIDVTSYVKKKLLEGESADFGIRQEAASGLMMRINSREAVEYAPYLRISPARINDEAPTWPASADVSFSNLSETGVSLQWPSAVSAGDEVVYRVYRNGILLGEVAGNNYDVSGLTTGNTYTFTIQAGDGSGVWGTDGPYGTVRLLDTRLVQTTLGNVYSKGEPIAFKVETARDSVSWAVKDVWGRTASSGLVAAQNGEASIVVPLNSVGYFTLQAAAESDGSEPIELSTTFAVLDPYDFRAVDDSPFGVNTHFPWTDRGWSNQLMGLIEAAGFKGVRDSLSWSRTENPKGEYKIAPEHDLFVDEAVRHGLNPFLMLGYENQFYDGGSTPYTDEGKEGFAQYGKFILEHFEGKVKNLEIYNEFNIGFGDRGNGPADSRPDYYAPLLETTYKTMKSSQYESTLAGMSTSKLPLGWIEEVLRRGGIDNLDVVSIHPYQYPRSPENMIRDIKKLQDMILAYNKGEAKPIWLSEMGYPTHSLASGISEKKQADYVVRLFVLSMAVGIEKVFYYDFMSDGVDAANQEHNFGLVYNLVDERGSYAPKPAYAAVGALTRQLTGATFERDESDEEGRFRQYVFAKGGESIQVAWTEGGYLPVAIHSDEPVRIVDIMGNETTYHPVNGKIYYTLKDEPIYLLGNVFDMTPDETFSLTGTDSVIGNDAELSLIVRNGGSEPFAGTLKVNGQAYSVQAAPGVPAAIPVVAQGLEKEGELTVIGELYDVDGKLIGQLTAGITFNEPYEIQIRPLFTEDGSGKLLNVTIENHSAGKELVAESVQWSLGSLKGSLPDFLTIPPASSWTESIELEGLDNGVNYPLALSIGLRDYETVVVDSTATFVPVHHVSDGDVPVTIPWSAGTSKVTNYTGEDDLSADFTLRWDEEHLYLSAQVKDDIHSYGAVEKDIYNNDGIQFGIVQGIPGESNVWYEAGIAQTPAGDQIYAFTTPNGAEPGLSEEGELKVTRDEELGVTAYELKLPWTELMPVDPADGVFSFSLLLNENDGEGRNGFWEWGSGIGTAKDPRRYRTVQLLPSGEAGQVNKNALNEAIEQANGMSPTSYTTASWSKVQAALLEAEAVSRHPGATQSAIDEAESALRAALSQLVPRPPAGSGEGTSGGPVIQPNELRIEAKAGSDGIAIARVGRNELQAEMDESENGVVDVFVTVTGEADSIRIAIPSQPFKIEAELEVETVNIHTEWGEVRMRADLFRNNEAAEMVLVISKPPGDAVPAAARESLNGANVYDFELLADGSKVEFRQGDLSISLPYVISPGEQSHQIVVYYIDDSGRLIPQMNSSYDPLTGMASFQPSHFSLYAVAYANIGFDDLGGYPWARLAIETLAARGVLNGVEAGVFSPAGEVTRAEFVAMLIRAFGAMDLQAHSAFKDVHSQDWHYGAIASAEKHGIVLGKPDGRFGPDDTVSRQDIAVLLDRAAAKFGLRLPETGNRSVFADDSVIAEYAIHAVGRMNEAGVMQGAGDGR